MKELLAKLGYRVPQDIGLAHVTVRPSAVIIATAIETLASAVEHRRFGLPEIPRQTLVPGRWQRGTMVR